MPDKEGRLTSEEKGRVVTRLQATWAGDAQKCPICGNPHWIISDHIVQPVTLGAGNSVMLGGVGYPQIMMISAGCGYTLYFNAVMLGIIAPANPEGMPLPSAGGTDAKG